MDGIKEIDSLELIKPLSTMKFGVVMIRVVSKVGGWWLCEWDCIVVGWSDGSEVCISKLFAKF